MVLERLGGNKNTFNVDDVGYATAAAAGMSDGTMTVTGSSVGTKQGFSIVTYTGTNSNESIPHGLDSALVFILLEKILLTQISGLYIMNLLEKMHILN